MKGISTIIATILLLLIVIAIVGYSFGFFQQFFGQATSTGTQQLSDVQNDLQKSVRIEVANSTTVIIRNTGISLSTDEMGIFIDNNVVQCSWVPFAGTMSPQARIRCNYLGSTCNSGQTVKVATPGLSSQYVC